MNKILILLITGMFLGSFWLIILYNRFVDFSHGISEAKTELNALQAQNVAFKEKIFNLIDPANFQNSAVATKLVQDKNPEYFQIGPKWSYASQY